jgi:hypothetical protein
MNSKKMNKMTEPNIEKDELLLEIQKEEDETEALEAERHKHIKNRGGASGVTNCITIQAIKRAGLKLPPMTGMKASFGAARQGKKEHGHYSEIVDKLQAKSTKKDIVIGHDVMIETPITPNWTVESELDIARVKGGTITKTQYQFGSKIDTTYVKSPEGVYDKIWDIKTKGMLSYYKTLKEAKDGKIPFHWNGQFHVYMKATGKKELTVLLKDRDMGNQDSFVVHWDDRVWDWVVKHELRIEEMTEEFKTKPLADIHPLPEDLEYLATTPFSTEESEEDYPKCWKSCALSETKEVYDTNGTPKLELVKPCEMVCDILKPIAMLKFGVGQQWKRGSSNITIIDIDWDNEMITAPNKGYIDSNGEKGSKYEDSIYYALDTYAPIPPKGAK